MKPNRRLSTWLSGILRMVLMLTLLHTPMVGHAQVKAGPCPAQDMSYAKFFVDGVEIELCSTFLENLDFVTPDVQSVVQTATALDDRDIRRSISISAISYGLQSPVESLPVAFPGGVEAYRELTRSFRQSQGGQPQNSEPIQIFGKTAGGIVSLIKAPTNNAPMVLREWFAEAGQRIWIVRITYPLDTKALPAASTTDWANQIVIRSQNLAAPSRSLAVSESAKVHVPTSQAGRIAPSDLPSPGWWKGDCNVDNHSGSYALGSSYRGVKACGPLGRLRLVYFFPGAWGEYEWQCVELVMRFMYLAYGVRPYSANGKDVVNNFPTSQYQSLNVEKVANGTPQRAPRPGDVISYGSNSTYGHTSIVSESNVDGNGNGSIRVVEQNYSRSGSRTHEVQNWVVKASDGVSNWLRFNSSGTPPQPPPNRAPNRPSPNSPGDWHVQRDGRAPTLCWNNNGDPDNDQVEFYAEVFDSARIANSGWTRSTCWRPGELDGQYYNYQWRVKAKDSRGAESGWSDVRHFSIEAANEPPRISFDTANGNGDSRITHRDQTWTFRGTASDPENRFSRVEFRCDDCDNRGSGEDRSTSTNWAITRNGMSGRNYVFFEAFDDRQSTRSAKTLELNIDLAAPTTEAQIIGNAPYGWFTEPAQVRLTARDNGTGRAVADVREVRYRRDGGSEQVQSGAIVNFTEGSDGEHTIRYYAVDNVGNTEGERSATYRVDRTPPSAIGGVSESSGVANGVWQKAQNKPTFTWNASSDAHSGLGGYQFYFGTDANGTAVHFDVGAGAARTLTPNNLGVATGTYYLRGRTWDRAGNASAWQTLFTFRYDGTPPENPTAATHALGATVVRNDVWQRASSVADFTWPVPHDEGSGVKGYSVYWGGDPAGTAASFITANRYQSGAPLCGVNAACTGYLRLRSRDQVDNEPAGWATAFVLRYDNAPPVADFTFSQGMTTTQTLVNLQIAATDQGSGVAEMRLSGDGQSWTSWEVYTTTRPWEIPGISRQSWPVYLQVKDGVGLTSAVISRTIYLDVNPQQPRSAGFRLFDYAMSAGGGEHTSAPTGYKGRSTVGQVVDSARITSTNYILAGGYQAGSQAIPIVEPGHDEFEFVNGIFASGAGATTLTSLTFRMIGTLGEIGVPNNETTLLSQRHQLQPGFLAAAPRAIITPTPTPTPGPTPTPPPTPACDFPRVSINDGAVFTTDTHVTLSLCAPNATEMMVSNDGGFGGAAWEPYARTRAWTLTSHSDYVVPRFVYAAFRDARGQIYATFLDDIILDPVPPEARVRVGTNLPLDSAFLAAADTEPQGAAVFQAQGLSFLRAVNGQPLAAPIPLVTANADGAVDLYLSARDNVGNVTRMQVSESGSFEGAWEPYNAQKQYTSASGDGVKTVYARFQDEAGNVSQPVTATFALDTQPPLGGIALSQPILGPDVVTTTVWLGAEDNLSGVAAMRLSTDPTFADAVWRPFAPTLTWVYAQADRGRAALHVQFRDGVGNVSEVSAAPLLVDEIPPQVYVEVAEGDTLTRSVRIYSYDELTYPSVLRLTNDPLFLAGVVTQPYTDTVTWAFDERRVIWVQVKDAVGNWSEPYPAYAAQAAPAERRVYLPLVLR